MIIASFIQRSWAEPAMFQFNGKANLSDFIAATGIVILHAKIEAKSVICRPAWPWNQMDNRGKQ